MKKKNFYYKSSSLHFYHFITPYLAGNSYKKMTLNFIRN